MLLVIVHSSAKTDRAASTTLQPARTGVRPSSRPLHSSYCGPADGSLVHRSCSSHFCVDSSPPLRAQERATSTAGGASAPLGTGATSAKSCTTRPAATRPSPARTGSRPSCRATSSAPSPASARENATPARSRWRPTCASPASSGRACPPTPSSRTSPRKTRRASSTMMIGWSAPALTRPPSRPPAALPPHKPRETRPLTGPARPSGCPGPEIPAQGDHKTGAAAGVPAHPARRVPEPVRAPPRDPRPAGCDSRGVAAPSFPPVRLLTRADAARGAGAPTGATATASACSTAPRTSRATATGGSGRRTAAWCAGGAEAPPRAEARSHGGTAPLPLPRAPARHDSP